MRTATIYILLFASLTLFRGSTQPPRLLQAYGTLEARYTLALVGIDELPTVTRSLDRLWRQVEADAPELRPYFDPVWRLARIGFDPRTKAGWRSVGIDPRRAALVFDSRIIGACSAPIPIVLIRSSTPARLDMLARTKLPGLRVLKGRRGADTAVLAVPRATPLIQGAFRAFLLGRDTPLEGNDAFRQAFGHTPDAPGAHIYISTEALAELDESVGVVASHLSTLFPALTMHGGPDGAGLRVVSSERGRELLLKLLVAGGDTDDVVRYLHSGLWFGGRLTLNLAELLDGLSSLFPSELPQTPAGLELAELQHEIAAVTKTLPYNTGIDWQMLSEGLTGHVAFAVPKPSPTAVTLDWVALVGVRDPAIVDEVLERLRFRIRFTALDLAERLIADHKAYELMVGERSALVVVRVDETLVLSSSATAAVAAVSRACKDDHLVGQDELLDGDAVFAVITPQSSARASWGLRVDEHGLVSAGQSDLAAGMIASFVVPSVLDYLRGLPSPNLVR